MKTEPTIEIIHLEDSALDFELAQEQLRSAGLEAHVVRVQTEAELRAQLKRPEVDLVLADMKCPGCDGFRALALVREERPDVPFLFLSGTMDHRDAVESLSAGVTDFVFKQHLPQVVPAVRRAIREARERAELQKARANLNAQAELLDLANDSIILCDSGERITYWNCGSQRLYGWTRAEAVGRPVHELLRTSFPHGQAEVEKALRQESHWEGELEQTRRDGTLLCVASHWTLKADSHEFARLLINTDITARKKTEDALRYSEERYRRFVDEDLTGNIIIRSDGHIETCNPAFLRIFGFASTEEALQTNFMSLLRTRRDAVDLMEKVREQRTLDRYEMEMRQPSGEAVYAISRLVGSFDAAGALTHVQVYLFNDTKRKRLEQQLVQAQKMEGLGTLAGGIAHDFNNILAIILGYTTQLEKRGPTQPEQIPVATKVIREAVERGAALVQQLLTSARQTESRLSATDLNDLVRELERMLRATFPKTIDFKLDLLPDLPLVTADRSQIHQVLLNLCVNARDAMPRGGSVSLETCLTSGRELEKFFTGADAPSYACVRVRDTGAGMTAEVKAHIFEPFYTTKERAKGTGLGLSVVYGVVNNHRGFIQVESEPGAGTTFSIYLPLAGVTGKKDEGDAERQRGSWEPQTILIAEDEEMLRELCSEILQGEGYRVLAAKDGVEAVEIFAANRDAIGLVVCDLGLPRLSGHDVFRQLKEMKPSVRALIVSGYLEPAQRSEILKAGVIDTIQKPYDFRELVAKIQSVIGKAQSDDDHPQLF